MMRNKYHVQNHSLCCIFRHRCPIVGKNVDFARLKKENYFCREAAGDRNKAFPSCCPSLQCKHYVEGKLVPLPKHKYPTLR